MLQRLRNVSIVIYLFILCEYSGVCMYVCVYVYVYVCLYVCMSWLCVLFKNWSNRNLSFSHTRADAAVKRILKSLPLKLSVA